MSHGQIVSTVIFGKIRLEWPASMPPALAALGARCLAHCANDRPSFTNVCKELEEDIVPALTSTAA